MSRIVALTALLLTSLGAPGQEGPRRHMQQPAQTSVGTGVRVISGTVVGAANGQPLEGADVTLNDTKTGALVAETVADAEGRFAFEHLPDAKFSLRASHRGFIAAAFQEHQGYSTAIVTGNGQVTTGLKFPLEPQGVLYGTVADDSGDPVAQSRVSLYRQSERNGTGNIVRISTVMTDDLGNYEFPRLEPGNYYIGVTGRPWYAIRPMPMQEDGAPRRSPLDVAFPTAFYADVTDADSATPIPVKAGDRIPVNFTLHAVPAVHLTMQLPNPGRDRAPSFPVLLQQAFSNTDYIQGDVSYVTHQEGGAGSGTTVVEIGGIAPGHYELEVREPRGEPGRSASVDASSANQTVDLSASDALPDVSGKLAMADGERLPARLNISLESTAGAPGYGVQVEADGTFEMKGVRPGNYEVLGHTGDASVAPAQMTAAGGAVEGDLLKVGNAPVTLAATLLAGSGSVEGFARENGRPAPGIMILLVPAHPGTDRQLFRRDQSDSDGSFSLKRVIPGQYTLVAIEDGWTLDWAHPEVIEHYLPHGLKVTVPNHSHDIKLSDAVEVQPK